MEIDTSIYGQAGENFGTLDFLHFCVQFIKGCSLETIKECIKMLVYHVFTQYIPKSELMLLMLIYG